VNFWIVVLDQTGAETAGPVWRRWGCRGCVMRGTAMCGGDADGGYAVPGPASNPENLAISSRGWHESFVWHKASRGFERCEGEGNCARPGILESGPDNRSPIILGEHIGFRQHSNAPSVQMARVKDHHCRKELPLARGKHRVCSLHGSFGDQTSEELEGRPGKNRHRKRGMRAGSVVIDSRWNPGGLG